MKANEIKWPELVKKEYQPKRTYDVRVTLIKSGRADGKMSIRFGFLNKAAAAFHADRFLLISEPQNDRIYFLECSEKKDYRYKKILFSAKKDSSGKCLCTSFIPSDELDKVYRAKWIGGTFKLQYDDECEMYFIERKNEE